MIQVASPHQIYDRPKTAFVADFIGSPSMNLFPAKLAEGGRIACEIPELAGFLEPAERARATSVANGSGDLLIGVRPEHLRIVAAGSAGAAEAEVNFVEPLGQTTNVYVKSGERSYIVVTDHTTARIGDVIGVAALPDRVRLVALN